MAYVEFAGLLCVHLGFFWVLLVPSTSRIHAKQASYPRPCIQLMPNFMPLLIFPQQNLDFVCQIGRQSKNQISVPVPHSSRVWSVILSSSHGLCRVLHVTPVWVSFEYSEFLRLPKTSQIGVLSRVYCCLPPGAQNFFASRCISITTPILKRVGTLCKM